MQRIIVSLFGGEGGWEEEEVRDEEEEDGKMEGREERGEDDTPLKLS